MAVIQPMWAIEEYARIFRSWVWFNPPHPPKTTDNMDIESKISRLIEWEIWYRIDNGASFCQVRMIMPDDRGIPWVTSGTQKWNGASPSFMARAIVMIAEAVGLVMCETVHWPECKRLRIMANINSIDAVACVRKYLVAASVARGLGCFISIGMTANRFISNPIQTRSQCELIIVIRVPEIIVSAITVKIMGLISTGRM